MPGVERNGSQGHMLALKSQLLCCISGDNTGQTRQALKGFILELVYFLSRSLIIPLRNLQLNPRPGDKYFWWLRCPTVYPCKSTYLKPWNCTDAVGDFHSKHNWNNSICADKSSTWRLLPWRLQEAKSVSDVWDQFPVSHALSIELESSSARKHHCSYIPASSYPGDKLYNKYLRHQITNERVGSLPIAPSLKKIMAVLIVTSNPYSSMIGILAYLDFNTIQIFCFHHLFPGAQETGSMFPMNL